MTKSTKTAKKEDVRGLGKLESEDGRAVRRSGRGGSKRPKEDVKFVSERAGPAEYYEVVDEEAFEAAATRLANGCGSELLDRGH